MQKGTTPNGRAPVARKRPRAIARPRTDDANAFMPDPEGGPAHIPDDLAENLAEEFVDAVTGGDGNDGSDDGAVTEEIGGPFIVTSAADEFAHDIDAANPADAEREPLPRPGAGLVQSPEDE
jgi:hypothetical protein